MLDFNHQEAEKLLYYQFTFSALGFTVNPMGPIILLSALLELYTNIHKYGNLSA